MFEMKAGYILWTKKSKNGTKVDFILNEIDEPVAKRCHSCSEMLPLASYYKDRHKKYDGHEAHCTICRKVYREKNAEHINNRSKQWRKDNKERARKQNKAYRESNKDVIQFNKKIRRTKIASLPSTLTVEENDLLKEIQGGRCLISDTPAYCDLQQRKSMYTLEHFIPVSWGAGGTTFENCYYMEGSINISKHNKNPFEWIKTQPAAYQERFNNILVPMLAERNGMSVDQFIQYVYECEQRYKDSKELGA